MGVLASFVLAWLRGELRNDKESWKYALDPLAGLALSVGLLGSVVSFIVAFGGFKNGGFDVERITSGLATAYFTTAVGLITSLVAGLGSYLLGVAVKRS